MAMPSPGVRLERLADALQIIRPLLHAGHVEHDGRHHHVHATSEPRPVQPHVPVFVGGKGDRLLRVAARHADGWNACWAWTPEAYAERAATLDEACDVIGRDPATVWRSLGLYALCGEDERDLQARFDRMAAVSPAGVLRDMTLERWREGRLVGTASSVREQVQRWAASGVETLIVGAGAVPFQIAAADDVDLLAAALGLSS
jgi:alkanesulfonate monooxygenase SsuD/methylene tetrahydromethanopterin reductase-like flavin-dependent oxidoreductase (luciferase family)